ncbi:MAG: hypothetical protein WBV94_31605 [Blastocatellia bacterium]
MKNISIRIPLAIALSLMCVLFDSVYVGCRGAADSDAVLRQEFKIRYGQEVTVKGEGLKVKFVSVPDDSRCPENVTCVWEGDAKIMTSVRRASAEESQIELHTNGKFARSGRYQQYVITLVSLDPYPKTDANKKQSDYVATLQITKE